MTLRATILVAACWICAHHARRVQEPVLKAQADTEADVQALAMLLSASKPASGFSAASAPIGTATRPTRGRDAYMQAAATESWKDYLTRAVATLEKIEAAKKAEAELDEPEPMKPLRVFDSNDFKEAAQKYRDYTAKKAAAKTATEEKLESLKEYESKLEEEMAKVKVLAKSIGADFTDEYMAKRKQDARTLENKADIAAAEASYNKLMERADSSESLATNMAEAGVELDVDEIAEFRGLLGSTFIAFAKAKQYFPEMSKFFAPQPDDTKVDYETPGVNVAPIYGLTAEGTIVPMDKK